MEVLIKSIKIQLIGFVLFAILTVCITLLLMFTPFREGWTYISLIVVLSIICLFIGVLEGRLVGKKGLIVGILTSAAFIFMIYCIVNTVFNDGSSLNKDDIFLVITIISGAIGGIVGTNTEK